MDDDRGESYESVVAALVSPEAIAVNRAQLAVLALTNYLRQASSAIAATETEYERSAEVPIIRTAVPSNSWWAAAPGFVSATQDVITAIPKALQALSSPPRTTQDVELPLATPSSVAIRNLIAMHKTTMLLAMPDSVSTPREHTGDGRLAASVGSGMSVGSLTVPQRWIAQTPASQVSEIPSEQIWEPMRLVHTAGRHSSDR